LFREQFHYDWHWSWNTGNGEIGNQAPHEIDMANWLLDARQLPAAVHGCGGRFGWDDAGETPNMQLVWYELAGVPVVIEVDDLKVSPQRKVRPVRDGIRVGLVVRCEGGQLRGGLGGTYAVDPAGKTLRKFPGNGGATHQENFIAAVRSRRSADIASPVAQAERAAAIAHLANLSFRAGAPADAAALAQAAGENETAGRVLADHTKQLADWGLAKPPYTLGRKLELDPATGTLRTTGIDPALIRPAARAEFAIPELA
jgi:predicted dehydrogenase